MGSTIIIKSTIYKEGCGKSWSVVGLYASEEKLTEKILKEEDPEAYKSLIRWKRIIKELHEDDKRNVRPSNKRRAKPCFGLG